MVVAQIFLFQKQRPDHGIFETAEKFKFRFDCVFTKGVIFVIDSNDQEKLSSFSSHEEQENAQHELKELLEEDLLKKCPFLILANKNDLPNSLSEIDFRSNLGDFLPGQIKDAQQAHHDISCRRA